MSSGPTPRNALTVDVEEWFHICGAGSALAPAHWDRLPSRVVDTTHRVLDLLAAANITATFFIVGWVAERHPALVAEIVGAGHEVGSHSFGHQKLYEMQPEGFRRDLTASVAALAAAGAGRVELFRAPEWSINKSSLWALDILAAERFTLDASMAPLRIVGDIDFPRYPHLRHTSAGTIREVPPFVADRFGQAMPMGWGWGLRMMPPSRVLRSVAKENRAGRAAVFTIHPWELDPAPPRVSLPPRLHFAHYFRLNGFATRLREVLMSGVPFGPIGTLPVSGDAV